MNYSPLCDNNLVAYLAYLAFNSCNGVRAIESSGVDGGDCVDSRVNGCYNNGGNPVVVFRSLLREARCELDDLDLGCSSSGVGGYIHRVIGPCTVRGEVETTGLADRDDGGGVCGLDRGICHGVDGSDAAGSVKVVARPESGVSDAPVLASVDSFCQSDGHRGETKTERNRRWRAERKEKKLRRRERHHSRRDGIEGKSGHSASGSKDWRADREERTGFFSECSSDVQRKLRESRAALLIAKNEHDRVVVEKKTKDLGSNVRLVTDAIKLMRLQGQLDGLQKKGNTLKVGGWAKTVLSNESNSFVNVAASERSSVPSLDSVVDDSVSQVDNSDEKLLYRELRLTQYRLKCKQVEEQHDDIYSAHSLQYELERVKEEFSDVVEDDVHAGLFSVGDKLVGLMGHAMNSEWVAAMVELGLLPDTELNHGF